MRLIHLFVCCLVFPVLQACSTEQSTKVSDANSVLESGRNWDLIGKGYQLTADSAVDGSGNVYFTDARTNRILKVDGDGHITVWIDNSGGAHGVAMGPDGRLYAGQHDRKRIVTISSDGQQSVVA